LIYWKSGEALREYTTRLGLGQAELAEAAKIPGWRLGVLSSGRVRPSALEIDQLASALGQASPCWLIRERKYRSGLFSAARVRSDMPPLIRNLLGL
jgi:transcriptional regulator with XRE-family HTH domain